MKKTPKARKLPTGSKRTPSSRASTSSTASTSKWIRIDRPFPLPSYVKDAIQRLDDAGHVAYVVGGSVRDFFLGRDSKDHDIATSAGPDELCRLFPEAITVGKAFGVLKIPLAPGGGSDFLEIATFREDLEYEDHRHPTSVRFTGADEDAGRRDFTVNALYFDPKTSRILDPTEGLNDLKARHLRAIGNPTLRFKEDALRLLRAIRFASTLEFTIDPATTDAIRAHARLITHVSKERIRDELSHMWKGPHPALALEMLGKLGLLKHILPEIDALRTAKKDGLWGHTLKLLHYLAEQEPVRSVPLAWAGVLHGLARPLSTEVDAPRITKDVASRLKLSGEEADQLAFLISEHSKFREVFQMREATLERFVRQPHFEELLALHRADATATDGNLAFHEFCVSRYRAAREADDLRPARLLDGNDLIQLGLSPGPHFSEILRTIEDLALERKIHTKEEALEYVVRHFVK